MNLSIEPHENAAQWKWLAHQIGTPLTCYVLPPDEYGRVFVDPNNSAIEPDRQAVSHPNWDFVLRSIRNGSVPMTLRVSEAVGESAALPQLHGELPELAPTRPSKRLNWLREHLQSLPIEKLIEPPTAPIERIALQAGLFQLHDYLDESHQCSQQIEHEGRDRNGDYWHAIMHRREPDYSNSKYWFRSVGNHPIFPRLAKLAAAALTEASVTEATRWLDRIGLPARWCPFEFVDLCQRVERSPQSPLAMAARRIQRAEQLLLFAHTVRSARGA